MKIGRSARAGKAAVVENGLNKLITNAWRIALDWNVEIFVNSNRMARLSIRYLSSSLSYPRPTLN